MTTQQRHAPPAGWALLTPTVALSVIARAVSSSLRLDEVLRAVVRITCEVMHADRATVLLLGDDQVLTPAVSHGRVEDPESLQRFRRMPPLPLAHIPGAVDALQSSDALVIPDVASSPYIPASWKDAFGLTSLLLSPIVADGECFGALVVDYAEAREDFAKDEVLTIEGIAACTATALRNARLYDEVVRRASGLTESLRTAADLHAATTTRGVLEVAVDGLLRVLDGQQASIHSVEPAQLTTLAARGGQHPEPGRYRLAAGDADCLAVLSGELSDVRKQLAELVVFERLPLEGPTFALPLSLGGQPALCLVSCAEVPDEESWRLAHSMAWQTALAMDRARLTEELESRLVQLETSYRLSEELALAADLDEVVDRLAEPIRTAASCELIDVFLCPGRNSDRFASRPAGAKLNTIMRGWIKRPPQASLVLGGLLLVPMMLDAEPIGVLRLRPVGVGPTSQQEEYLMAIAGAVANVVSRADLSARVVDAQRELTVSQERERIARDLHDTLGQSLFALGLQLSECSTSTDDEELRASLNQARAAADAAGVQLRQAIHELAFLKKSRSSLLGAIKGLTADLPAGMSTLVRSVGRPVTLPPVRTEALLRVAREALVNVARHSRATDVTVLVKFEPHQVALTIADNGVGLGQRSSIEGGAIHFGIRSMKRRLEESGGSLTLSNLTPNGLKLVAQIPVA